MGGCSPPLPRSKNFDRPIFLGEALCLGPNRPNFLMWTVFYAQIRPNLILASKKRPKITDRPHNFASDHPKYFRQLRLCSRCAPLHSNSRLHSLMNQWSTTSGSQIKPIFIWIKLNRKNGIFVGAEKHNSVQAEIYIAPLWFKTRLVILLNVQIGIAPTWTAALESAVGWW